LVKIANRRRLGTISRKNSSRLPAASGNWVQAPMSSRFPGGSMPEADDTEEVIRAQRELVQLYRDFIAEVRALRIELEAEMARLRAVMRAIEAERDLGVLQ
jgi:hypothetical protein